MVIVVVVQCYDGNSCWEVVIVLGVLNVRVIVGDIVMVLMVVESRHTSEISILYVWIFKNKYTYTDIYKII